ncbi:MAG TPA: molecular chaperone TorD family protein [Peptococcaceae bacterium]|nr:molecular chaperone TorD family protein [Peptococcaceae bacterium]
MNKTQQCCHEMEYLYSRKTIYEFLGFVFYNKLELKHIKGRSLIKEFLGLLTGQEAMKIVPGINELKKALKKFNDSEKYYLDLRKDYQALFEGPGPLLAPPWESVYLSEEKLMFEVQTFQVRHCYRKYGLRIEKYGKEPEDHIGLELQFMGVLAGKSLDLLQENKSTEFSMLIEEQRDFLQTHLLKWVDQFAQKVQKGSTTDFYKGLALFLTWYLKNDFDLISSLSPDEEQKEVNL